eukprot:TRINITY_DN1011_c0_g1_i7.p1 TRINITY_DN1011_c0_g1~~TRINITY_DN1011_c0_g1_i7.p1  ORF type:complete len:199 (+),score=75.27 TRINITY_DN1011_c0_g1_i7:75-671(+)
MHVPIEHRAQIVNSIADVQHEHNSWDVVRSRKDLTTVRCRECQYQVKMKDVRRCEEFAERRRCRRVGCREMHVHQQKMSLEERVKKYGSGVLDKVPPSLRRGLDEDDVPPTLLDPDEEKDLSGYEDIISSDPPTPPSPGAHTPPVVIPQIASTPTKPPTPTLPQTIFVYTQPHAQQQLYMQLPMSSYSMQRPMSVGFY